MKPWRPPFVDEINRLMWLTDYEGAIVEDKIKSGLTGELRRGWAKLTTKPHSVAEQLRVLRDMGHALEDLDKKDAGSKPNSKGAKREDSKGNPTDAADARMRSLRVSRMVHRTRRATRDEKSERWCSKSFPPRWSKNV